MKNAKLSTKLLVAFLAVGVIPACVIGLLALNKSSQALQEQSYSTLIGMRDVKKGQIEQFFEERQGDINVLTENISCIRQEAFKKMEAIQTLKQHQVEQLLARMRKDVECGAESKECLDFFQLLKRYYDESQAKADGPLDISTDQYKEVWAQVDQYWQRYVKDYGYYDVFMIGAENGHVLYTNFKESDLGTNLKYGPQKDEGLARLWQKVVETQDVVIEDFSSYSPSSGDQAAFMGAPILDDAGKVVCVFALQMPKDPINAIVQTREGLGVSGETYLIGKCQDKISFRSNLLTMGNGKYVVGHEIHTGYIDKVLSGGKQEFQQIYTDSAGKLVLVSADTLEIEGLHWGVITKMDFEEAVTLKLEGQEEDFLTQYNNIYGYYDVFLITPEGNCFYTVCHEADYQTNFVDGKYSDSGLGQLTREVVQSKQFGLADFAPYAPSNGDPAAFIAKPVVNNGTVELVVAMQLSLEAINNIMQQRAGMGETGETYLVGQDKLMRSDSFLDPTGHSVKASFAGTVGQNGCDTEAATEALGGSTDAKIILDYNGNPVLSAYTPIEVGNTTWALLAEIDKAEAFKARNAIVWIMSVVSVISVVSIVVLAMLITRSIVKPINRIIAGLTEGAEQVASASGQVSSASQSLAEGATEQAAGLEETSSSLEEMSSMTKQNADNAVQANSLASEAKNSAQNGSDAMGRMSAAINDIQKSSDETAKIIKVIDEIAFQTNLLALNAAVEAARAGEAGKGFAVVAEEVRNLAMRSAEAAKDTSNLIEESVKNSRNGVEISTEVGQVLEEIVTSVSKTTDLVGEIAAASQEQAQGIDQVNTAVAQMDKVTQQNAANAEESASASEELSAQAESMNQIVSDLVRLVEGASSSRSSFNRSSARRPAGKKLPLGDQAFHQIVAKPTAKVGAGAEQEIPFDEDFSDFD